MLQVRHVDEGVHHGQGTHVAQPSVREIQLRGVVADLHHRLQLVVLVAVPGRTFFRIALAVGVAQACFTFLLAGKQRIGNFKKSDLLVRARAGRA